MSSHLISLSIEELGALHGLSCLLVEHEHTGVLPLGLGGKHLALLAASVYGYMCDYVYMQKYPC